MILMRFKLGNFTFGGGSRIRLRLADWLLIIGLSFAPMTGLRIWKVGPAEVLCLLWGFRFMLKLKFRMTDLLKFFIGFIGCMLLGSIVGYFVARSELRPSGLLTWMYLAFIAVSMEIGLSKNSVDYNEKLLNTFATCAVLLQLILYFYSKNISTTFLGAPLWYHGVRYTGGGTNPHQVAVLLCAVMFVFARNIIAKRRIIISIAMIAGAVFLLKETDSSTGILSIALGFLVLIFLRISNISSTKKRFQMLALTTLIIGLILLLTYSRIYTYVMNWIEDDANGMGRLSIFSSFGNAFRKDPVFGLGPGVHGADGKIEFHNTYLEIFAAAGTVGFIFFFIYTIRCIKKLWDADWTLIPILVSIYAYGVAGFAMRRLAYWSVMIFISVIASQLLNESPAPETALDRAYIPRMPYNEGGTVTENRYRA